MRARAFIFARGGSKGVPRKNIRSLAGVPLIGHAIATARRCKSLGEVVVSTDDEQIAEVARDLGAKVPFIRPSELAGDTASEWLAWRHAIAWSLENEGEFDLFVSLPTTSPFRSTQDVEKCIDALRYDPSADIAITVKRAERSPYFNMVHKNAQGYAQIAIEKDKTPIRRQDAPEIFDMTTVAYVARPQFVLKKDGIFQGNVVPIEIPPERALDIDTQYDFELAELIATAKPQIVQAR